MEVNQSIKEVLRNFQTAAVYSLGGPFEMLSGDSRVKAVRGEVFRPGRETGFKTAQCNMFDENVGLQVQRFHQKPLLLPQDSSVTAATKTVLEGETISCFAIGGENRLCVPEVLQKVLSNFNLNEIHRVYEELHIFTSLCTDAQLCTLRHQGTLPQSAATCGLISRTYAERLCSQLLHHSGELLSRVPPGDVIRVQHCCFGKCYGLLFVSLYSSAVARCVKCCECGGMFSPSEFVCHAHGGLENRTCHWGFDSSHWRNYMKLAGEDKQNARAQKLMMKIKTFYDRRRIPKRSLSDDCCFETAEEKLDVRKKSCRVDGDNWTEDVEHNRHDKRFAQNAITSRLLCGTLEEHDEKDCYEPSRGSLNLVGNEVFSSPPQVTRGPEEFRPPSSFPQQRGYLAQKELEEKAMIEEVLQQQSRLMATELDFFNLALEQGSRLSAETKQRVVDECIELQKQYLSLATKLIGIKKACQQELVDFKTRMNETIASTERENENRRWELSVLLRSNSTKLEEVKAENEQLLEANAVISGCRRTDVDLMKAKYKAQVEHFGRKLRSVDNSNAFLAEKSNELLERLAQYSPADFDSLSLGYESETSLRSNVVTHRSGWQRTSDSVASV